jgi:hypothetical protein
MAMRGSTCPPPRALDTDWTFTAAAGAGLDVQIVRGWHVEGELGWRRYFFGTGERDVRGLWLGFSFG